MTNRGGENGVKLCKICKKNCQNCANYIFLINYVVLMSYYLLLIQKVNKCCKKTPALAIQKNKAKKWSPKTFGDNAVSAKR